MRVRVTAVVLAIAGAAAGCGTGGSERDARDAVQRFSAALAERDGRVACDELTEDAQAALERQQKAPCEQAVLELELSPSTPVEADVAITSAVVDTDEGDTLFLDQTAEGWRISAAGCEEVPGQPYDCELGS